MNEQTPPQPNPEKPDAHQQIAGSIEAAAAGTLPAGALTVDRDFEGQTRIATPNHAAVGSVQLSKEADSPDIAIGHAEFSSSVQDGKPVGAYGFTSSEGNGVQKAMVRRVVIPGRDTITRAGAAHHENGTSKLPVARVYEHDFSPAARDKVGKLATDMVISRAKRHGDEMERLRRAA